MDLHSANRFNSQNLIATIFSYNSINKFIYAEDENKHGILNKRTDTGVGVKNTSLQEYMNTNKGMQVCQYTRKGATKGGLPIQV
jgi:hypothetical protein